jgi:translation initiation factor 3 subunit E
VEQLQLRTWLLHWSLFVFAWHEEGRDAIVDFMFQPRCLEAISLNAPWLLRYLSAGVILHRTKRRVLIKELLRLFRTDDKTIYRDPIIEFVECLFVDFDFETAQTKLHECESVLVSDFFLYEKNLIDFMENARIAIFEMFCRIHKTIDIKKIANKLAIKEEKKAEKWIVNLIRNARLDAKIDSEKGRIVMGMPQTSVYRQVIDKTRDLAARTISMVAQFERMGKKKTNSY